MILQLTIADICMPDYFKGTDLPYIAVPVVADMTAKQFLRGIKEELRLGGVCKFPDLTPAEEEEWLDAACTAAKHALSEIPPESVVIHGTPGMLDEDGDTCAFILIDEVFIAHKPWGGIAE